MRSEVDPSARLNMGPLNLFALPASSNQALRAVNCLGGVRDCLSLGEMANEPFARFRHRNHRGHGIVPLFGLENSRPVGVNDRYAGVGGTEIYSDYRRCHMFVPLPVHAWCLFS